MAKAAAGISQSGSAFDGPGFDLASWSSCPLDVVQLILQFADAGIVYKSLLTNRTWLKLLKTLARPRNEEFWKNVFLRSSYHLSSPLKALPSNNNYLELCIRAHSMQYNITRVRKTNFVKFFQ